jgi:exosortase A
VLFLWIIFLFKTTFYGMIQIWSRSETFTHGFLVLPIVLWLIWQKRSLLFLKTPEVNFWFLIPVALVSFFWLLGDLVSVNSVTQLTATALIVLAVVAIFGWNVASVIIFPLLFLFFAVPLGEFLLPVLMEWTAKFTVVAIRWSGIPVYQDGLQFVISSGNWSVVEACSGVRYLISSFMIGTLYAYLNYQSYNRRLIFICISIVLPIFANWLRAYFIVMLGHLSGNTLAVGFDHIIYGWVFFGVVIAFMFLIGSRWTEDAVEDISKLEISANLVKSNNLKFGCAAFIFSALVSIPAFWNYFIIKNIAVDVPELNSPNFTKAGWTVSSYKLSNFKPGFNSPSSAVGETYTKDGSDVGIYIAYYSAQNYERKLVSSSNSLIDVGDKNWIKSSVGKYNLIFDDVVMPVQLTRWYDISVNDANIPKRFQAWQFYWVNGIFTGSDYFAKINGAVQRLLGKGDDSAVIVVYAVDNDSAQILLRDFLKNNYLEIKSLLENVRAE